MLRVNNICAEYLNTLFTFLSGRIPPSLCPPWEPPVLLGRNLVVCWSQLIPVHKGILLASLPNSAYSQIGCFKLFLIVGVFIAWKSVNAKRKKKGLFFLSREPLLNIYQHVTVNNCCPIFYISLVGSINSGGRLQTWHVLIPWPQTALTFISSDTSRKKKNVA